jgi:sugar lactone lactonase YvrE
MAKRTILTLIFIYLLFAVVGVAVGAIAPTATPLTYYLIPGGSPGRIAVDGAGRLYITDSMNHLIRIYSNNGVSLNTIRDIEKPAGIAVDLSGRIFVGDGKTKSVSVLDENGGLLYKLGSGDGEFGAPSDIAISSLGTVYVTDSNNNVVKKYNLSDGSFIGSFGSAELRFPTGIAVDDSAGEVYVSDLNNIKIRIYDLNGVYKREIRGGGSMGASGKLLRPQGIALDSTRVYVVDAYHDVVAVYDKNGTFLKYIGNYGSLLGEFKTPLDTAFDSDGKLFVTNNNNSRIEVIGIDTFTGIINIDPGTLSFSVYANGLPVTQTVNLTSIGNPATWTASTSASYITISPSSGSTPATVDITLNPSGLASSNYMTEIIFATPSGVESVLTVNVEVKKPILSVAPSTLSFTYQKNSASLPSETLVITSTGAVLTWTAYASESAYGGWVTLSSNSGTTPANLTVGVSDTVNTFELGTYTASVIIDAGADVIGSPATVDILLEIIYAGSINVITNLDEATFNITGPETFSGRGKTWEAENVTPGTYTISFAHVSGYIKPATKIFTVESGETALIEGIYSQRRVATHIVAGSGATNHINVISLADNTITSSFNVNGLYGGVRVAAGDLDDDGMDEIIVTPTSSVRTSKVFVYRYDGVFLADYTVSGEGLTATAGDIDGDSIADIVVGGEREGLIYLGYSSGEVYYKGRILVDKLNYPLNIAVGDIDGDGNNDILLSDRYSIRAFDIEEDSSTSGGSGNLILSEKWRINIKYRVQKGWTGIPIFNYKSVPNLSIGDLNDDGIGEIAVAPGASRLNNSTIKILNGDGSDYGITINAFGDLGYKYGASVSMGDIDGDFIDEIVAGAGPGPANEALIRLFESDGTFVDTIKAMDSLYGVNVSIGRFE